MEPRPPAKERFTGIIRPFEESDIPAVVEILEYWLQDDGVIAHDEVEEDVSDIRRSLQSDSDIDMFAAVKDGKVVGMMGLSIPPKAPLLQFAKTDSPSELRIAYNHPDYRMGKGVGTALINNAQNVAKAKGRKEILLESGPRHRETGYPFYDKQPGFTRAGVLKDFYGPGLHSQVWQKTF